MDTYGIYTLNIYTGEIMYIYIYIYIYTYVIYIYIPHPLPRAGSSWRLRSPLFSHSPSSRSHMYASVCARRLRLHIQDAYQHTCACRSRMNSRLFDYDLYCKFFDYDLFDYDLCFTTFRSTFVLRPFFHRKSPSLMISKSRHMN